MENDDLKSIWSDIHSQIKLYSPVELRALLNSKIRKTVNSFKQIFITSIIVCLGLILFLFITALNRRGDFIYQLNNFILILITLISLIANILSFNALGKDKYDLPVKDRLEKRINFLNKELAGKSSSLYMVLIPVLLIMITMSIHVYYEYKPFLEVIKDEESLYGLFFGFVVGLFVSYYASRKIRKYQMQKLNYLRELYAILVDENRNQ